MQIRHLTISAKSAYEAIEATFGGSRSPSRRHTEDDHTWVIFSDASVTTSTAGIGKAYELEDCPDCFSLEGYYATYVGQRSHDIE